MAKSSLANIPGFSVKFFFQPIYTWRAALSDTILKRDHPTTIQAKFALTWFSGFRGEDLNVIFLSNRQRRPPFKMAAVTKNRNFFSCQFLLYYKSK
jgi:hypothetical protein